MPLATATRVRIRFTRALHSAISVYIGSKERGLSRRAPPEPSSRLALVVGNGRLEAGGSSRGFRDVAGDGGAGGAVIGTARDDAVGDARVGAQAKVCVVERESEGVALQVAGEGEVHPGDARAVGAERVVDVGDRGARDGQGAVASGRAVGDRVTDNAVGKR